MSEETHISFQLVSDPLNLKELYILVFETIRLLLKLNLRSTESQQIPKCDRFLKALT